MQTDSYSQGTENQVSWALGGELFVPGGGGAGLEAGSGRVSSATLGSLMLCACWGLEAEKRSPTFNAQAVGAPTSSALSR